MNDRSRPAQAASEVIAATGTSVEHFPSGRDRSGEPRRCAHLRRGVPTCTSCVHSRRAATAELDALLGRLYPSPIPEPSTFGLSGDELRAEANKLFRAGWSVEEIRAVLDIPLPERAR